MIAAAILSDPGQVHPLRLAMLAADEVRQHPHGHADTTDRPTLEAVKPAYLLEIVADLLGKAAER